MLLTLFYFILALLLLITIHEFGHFIVARCCGVKVLRFSFGFGRVLFKRTDRKGTEFAWSMWPLGGYVKMLDETEAPVEAHERHLAFNTQALWKRTLIVLAGPAFNFLFALIVFWFVAVIGIRSLAPMIEHVQVGSIADQAGLKAGHEIVQLDQRTVRSWRDFLFVILSHVGSNESLNVWVLDKDTGKQKPLVLPLNQWKMDLKKPDVLGSLGIEPFIPKIPPIVGKVMENTPGKASGVQIGDAITAVDARPISNWMQLVEYVQERPGKVLQMTVVREGKTQTITVQVGKKDRDGKTIGFLGLASQKANWPKDWLRHQKDGPLEAVGTSFKKTWDLSATTLVFIGRLISGKLSLETVSGPVGIAQGAGQSGKSGLVYYLAFLGLVSISLGVLNLLPIPILDGGHLVFLVIEWVKGSPVSETTRVAMSYIGLLVLVGLMLVALNNDFARILS